MSRELTGDPGVGGGDQAADDDPVGLSRIELAEEVADEPLGTLVQSMEDGRELGIDIPPETKNQSEI